MKWTRQLLFMTINLISLSSTALWNQVSMLANRHNFIYVFYFHEFLKYICQRGNGNQIMIVKSFWHCLLMLAFPSFILWPEAEMNKGKWIRSSHCTVVELLRQGVTKLFQKIEMIETLVFSGISPFCTKIYQKIINLSNFQLFKATKDPEIML